MIARHRSLCPGCSEQITPGDSIGRIGLSFYCSECFEDFERKNASATVPVIASYPLSSTYEPGL